MLGTPLREVMTTNPISLRREDTVDKVQQIFENHSFHHIPVVDSEGILEGIVSKLDLESLSYGRSLFRVQNKESFNKALYRSLLVGDVMTRDVRTLLADDTVKEALDIFKKNLFHAIPILEEGRLTGIISCYDLLIHAYPNST